MYYIGIDLGTSAVKLLLMEGSGKICNIVSKEYPLFFPHPGWSEQNPEDWFTQSMEGIKELTEGIDRKEVAGIGFGGQMHGLVTLDKDDNVIRPAILWNDGRTGEETEYLNHAAPQPNIPWRILRLKRFPAFCPHRFVRRYFLKNPLYIWNPHNPHDRFQRCIGHNNSECKYPRSACS